MNKRKSAVFIVAGLGEWKNVDERYTDICFWSVVWHVLFYLLVDPVLNVPVSLLFIHVMEIL